jgi:tetratricopeptide (TPR) repeat protein
MIASTSDQLGRIRELTRAQQYEQALLASEMLRNDAPENGDVLYLLAVNQRCLQRIPAALATLEQLEREHPLLARLYQERGYCYINLRDTSLALLAFERAVSINPTLIASWTLLDTLYRMTGDTLKQTAAARQIVSLKRLPAEVIEAAGLFSDGDFSGAENLLRSFVSAHPDHHVARTDLARVLLARQDYAQANEQIQFLIAHEPDNVDHRRLQANAAAGCGDHDAAIHALQASLRPAPESAHLHVLLGHSLKAMGRQHDAIASYRNAIAARPTFGDAYWSLANLKSYQLSDAEIASLRESMTSDRLLPADELHMHFALGSALESREQYSQSWSHYSRGNALKRAQLRYRPESVETDTRRQIELWTREHFAALGGAGVADPAPIFIVGLPRSGSTLIEQILASHSLIEGTQELPHIPRMVQELNECSTPALTPRDCRRLGERYLSDTGAYRRRGAPFFIDKMPNNFQHIGLIHLMLPSATIIDARREPMACCFSNFKQLFASGHEFSYDQAHLARYYRAYLELMRHWDDVLPGRILRVFHEDLVEDLEANVRRLLDFCGLEFESNCVEFHKTIRPISTASSEQVRRPINRDGLTQWRHFQPWLLTLDEQLGDALTRYREP